MKQPVGIFKTACRLALSALVMVGVAACAPRYDPNAVPARAGYACCNLRFDGDWISDGNYAENPFIAVGTPISVYGYRGNIAYAEVGGRKMRLGHDYGRKEESLRQWIEKIIVTTDPAPRLARYPADLQEAIRAGKVKEGMTKEQAIMALGYPLTTETLSLDQPTWTYWLSSFDQYQLVWDAQGKVKVVAEPEVRAAVIYPPGK